MQVIIIILLYLFIIRFDLMVIKKRETKRDVIIYSVFLGISFIFLLLVVLDVKIPSPLIAMEKIIKGK